MPSPNQDYTVWFRFPISLLGIVLTTLGIYLVVSFSGKIHGFQWISFVVWLGMTLGAGPYLLVVGFLGRASWVQRVYEKIWGDDPD